MYLVLTVNEGILTTVAHFCMLSVEMLNVLKQAVSSPHSLLVMAQLKAMSYHAKLLLCNENQYLPLPFPHLSELRSVTISL